MASFAGAAAPPYPPWVSWAIQQGMIKTMGDWGQMPSQLQVAIKQRYLDAEAAKLDGLLAQQRPAPAAGMVSDPLFRDQLNGLTAIPMFQKRGATGPYIPMSSDRATNRHNKWFAKMGVDPIMLLGLRLRMGEGEAPLPFKFYTSYCNENYVWISYVVENDMITLKDDAHLFPSDELIATLKLAIEAFSR